jgi:cytochrome P450
MAWCRNDRDKNTINTIDITEHARKRKLLNISFTEKSVRAASEFTIRHVDRWNHLLVKDYGTDWSDAVNISVSVDRLVFDIMGDLCFGKSFDIKEPGENPLKTIPHDIAEYMRFYYPVSRFRLASSTNYLQHSYTCSGPSISKEFE